MSNAVELDIRCAKNEAFDVKGRQCDKVVFIVAVEVKQSMPHLFDSDRCAEGRLLCVVSLQMYPVFLVDDAICSDRRVMAKIGQFEWIHKDHGALPDLLAHEFCAPTLVFPVSQEELAQERIQRFLLTTKFLVSTAVLLLQGTEKPFSDQ